MKTNISSALDVLDKRMNDGKFGLYAMTFLNQSRSQYEIMRHLPSFLYNAETDKYERLVVWTNPYDETDSLHAPAMASRQKVDKERARVYEGCDVLVSADGMSAERDAEICWASTYSKYHAAIRDDFSAARPALLMLFADATGRLARQIGHARRGRLWRLEGGQGALPALTRPTGLW